MGKQYSIICLATHLPTFALCLYVSSVYLTEVRDPVLLCGISARSLMCVLVIDLPGLLMITDYPLSHIIVSRERTRASLFSLHSFCLSCCYVIDTFDLKKFCWKMLIQRHVCNKKWPMLPHRQKQKGYTFVCLLSSLTPILPSDFDPSQK